jgi:hypothetical protein
VAHYGSHSVFRDIDNIPLGADFREHINTMLAQTDVALVVIGKRWFGAGRGRRRIDDPADPVRIEVETALRSGMCVVPVLVEGGGMPKADQLPDSLKDLIYRNGLDVDSGRDFNQHIERLIRNIDPVLAQVDRLRAEAARRAEEEGQQATQIRRKAEGERDAGEIRREPDEERQAEEARRKAEAERQAEDARRKAEAERQAEEARRKAEAERQAEEARRKAEAERQAEEARRKAEAERQAEEARRMPQTGELGPRILGRRGRRRVSWSVVVLAAVAGFGTLLWYYLPPRFVQPIEVQFKPSIATAPESPPSRSETSRRSSNTVPAIPALPAGDLITLSGDPNQWIMQNGNYFSQRYSALNQINKFNVKDLRVLWNFSTGVLRGHEGGPLFVGNIIFIHTPFPNNVFALDLSHNGQILWKYEPRQEGLSSP